MIARSFVGEFLRAGAAFVLLVALWAMRGLKKSDGK